MFKTAFCECIVQTCFRKKGGGEFLASLVNGDRAPHMSTSWDRAPHMSTNGDRATHMSTSWDRAPHADTNWDRAPHMSTNGDRATHMSTSSDRASHADMSCDRVPHAGKNWDRAPLSSTRGTSREHELRPGALLIKNRTTASTADELKSGTSGGIELRPGTSYEHNFSELGNRLVVDGEPHHGEHHRHTVECQREEVHRWVLEGALHHKTELRTLPWEKRNTHAVQNSVENWSPSWHMGFGWLFGCFSDDFDEQSSDQSGDFDVKDTGYFGWLPPFALHSPQNNQPTAKGWCTVSNHSSPVLIHNSTCGPTTHNPIVIVTKMRDHFSDEKEWKTQSKLKLSYTSLWAEKSHCIWTNSTNKYAIWGTQYPQLWRSQRTQTHHIVPVYCTTHTEGWQKKRVLTTFRVRGKSDFRL